MQTLNEPRNITLTNLETHPNQLEKFYFGLWIFLSPPV